MRIFFRLILLILLTHELPAQDTYWIYLRDKGQIDSTVSYVSPQTYVNRSMLGLKIFQTSDVSLSAEYIHMLSQHVTLRSRSKWMNAVSATLSQQDIRRISQYSFVTRIVPIHPLVVMSTSLRMEEEIDLFALDQTNSLALQRAGLFGKGIRIGVIDGGFDGMNSTKNLDHLFQNGNKVVMKGFIKAGMTSESNTGTPDNHGTRVLQLIAGKEKDTYYGVAPSASYYLATTDDTEREFRGEEDNWIAALEWMDSLGVRLVNTSLGYSIGFDNETENHLPEEMNGRGTMAMAAQRAVNEKGMILIMAAGNNGGNAWKIVSTPGDAQDVITIGGTDKFGMKLPHSAIGNEAVSYLKPDISCFSNHGTSFSAPVITGIVACLLEKSPWLTSKRILTAIQMSGSLYPFANNYVGFGIPDAEKMLASISTSNDSPPDRKRITVKSNRYKVPDLQQQDPLVVFHKKNNTTVIQQELILLNTKKNYLYRPRHCSTTTVVFEIEVVEISWR